jgi:hypothetical protein
METEQQKERRIESAKAAANKAKADAIANGADEITAKRAYQNAYKQAQRQEARAQELTPEQRVVKRIADQRKVWDGNRATLTEEEQAYVRGEQQDDEDIYELMKLVSSQIVVFEARNKLHEMPREAAEGIDYIELIQQTIDHAMTHPPRKDFYQLRDCFQDSPKVTIADFDHVAEKYGYEFKQIDRQVFDGFTHYMCLLLAKADRSQWPEWNWAEGERLMDNHPFFKFAKQWRSWRTYVPISV